MKKNIDYNLNFEKLCEKLSIGSLKDEPQQVFGGLLHKMYQLKTEKGMYAVKAINPQIMQREIAMKNYIFSENVVRIAFDNGINALPAIVINGNSIHGIDGQYYLVFLWFDGKVLDQNRVDINKSIIIGKLLAKIHKLDFSSIPKINSNNFAVIETDWNNYVQRAKVQNLIWVSNFSENIDKLYKIEKQANIAIKEISENLVISHRDLDPKNVLWDEDDVPMIIDWEAAGTVNPSLELIEVALYWSGGEKNPNKEAFCAVIDSYIKNGGIICDNLEDALHSVYKGKLGWLEYNMKRSLRMECSSDEEQKLGTEEVVGTMQSIWDYSELIPVLLKWL